ncbi:hypothetical protein PTSG_00728 [Salpingoeca rosetta]|uniref:RBR-type E3 ubiquitin transferase n=1 Tax=Salpingoeca rosetta (strain ATCC 50818 / BSB-021) TaxID=946362 RepID=F2TXB0_SALR5|nr:uncharacterized protein PTSG_00728 [Salpingoeca rosetta]EGD76019.1 hypothetical protein PTSG_00728 [Salpingoeca rosetta]|eukprot:XP_004998194.1 hypothetical protein PTSG_00728 [Salpingoeca rosetta]
MTDDEDRSNECVVCGLDEDVAVVPKCHHGICKECLRMHAKSCMDTRRLPVQCAACTEDVPLNMVLDALPPEEQDQLSTAMLRAALEKDPQVRFCPAPDCGYAVFLGEDMTLCPYASCDRCGTAFCTRCKHKAHGRNPCVLTDLPPNTKPCPKCFAPIEKAQDGSCNHVRCYVCKTDFCWLCLKPLSQMDTINHYVGMTGCTMFGSKPWSEGKRLAVHRSSPLWVPFAIGLGAVAVPLMSLSLPVVAAKEAYKDNQEASKARRVWRGFKSGIGTLLIGTPILAVAYTVVALKGAWFAYVKMPCREVHSCCRSGRPPSGVVDLTPQSALPSGHRLASDSAA